MEIEFGQVYLYELYHNGRTKNKKYRFQLQIIRNYIEVVDTLKSVTNQEDLYRMKNLHYEKKKGNFSGIEAVWINRQFRLEFKTRQIKSGQNDITFCTLLRISNHYHN